MMDCNHEVFSLVLLSETERYKFISEPKIRCLLNWFFRENPYIAQFGVFYKNWEFYLEDV